MGFYLLLIKVARYIVFFIGLSFAVCFGPCFSCYRSSNEWWWFSLLLSQNSALRSGKSLYVSSELGGSGPGCGFLKGCPHDSLYRFLFVPSISREPGLLSTAFGAGVFVLVSLEPGWWPVCIDWQPMLLLVGLAPQSLLTPLTSRFWLESWFSLRHHLYPLASLPHFCPVHFKVMIINVH